MSQSFAAANSRSGYAVLSNNGGVCTWLHHVPGHFKVVMTVAGLGRHHQQSTPTWSNRGVEAEIGVLGGSFPAMELEVGHEDVDGRGP